MVSTGWLDSWTYSRRGKWWVLDDWARELIQEEESGEYCTTGLVNLFKKRKAVSTVPQGSWTYSRRGKCMASTGRLGSWTYSRRGKWWVHTTGLMNLFEKRKVVSTGWLGMWTTRETILAGSCTCDVSGRTIGRCKTSPFVAVVSHWYSSRGKWRVLDDRARELRGSPPWLCANQQSCSYSLYEDRKASANKNWFWRGGMSRASLQRALNPFIPDCRPKMTELFCWNLLEYELLFQKVFEGEMLDWGSNQQQIKDFEISWLFWWYCLLNQIQ